VPLFLAFKAHEGATDRTLQLGGLHVCGVHLALAPVFSAISQKDVVVLIFGFLKTFEFVQNLLFGGEKSLQLAFRSRLGAASLQTVQFLDIAFIDEHSELRADTTDTKTVVAWKNECVLTVSQRTDLLFVANWTGLFANGLWIFLFFLKHLPLHLKRQSFVPFLKLNELVDRRPPFQ